LANQKLKEAERDIRAVEKYLRAGAPATVARSLHIKSATTLAYEELGIPRQTMIHRVGKPGTAGYWERRFGLKVDWTISPTNPGKPADEALDLAKETKAAKTARDHAAERAAAVSQWIRAMMTKTRHPVINPDALLIEPRIELVFDKASGGYVEVERPPRTWITATLQVAPIEDSAGRRFIFTGAQNDAPVHGPFWENLKAYAAYIGAEIVVGPWTYETAWFNESQASSRAYDPNIIDHICFGQMRIGDHFVFCAEMNTLPTAERPISDLVTYSRGRWAVFPHAKLQLKSVPSTDPDRQAHQVMTTGAVTLPKVAPRKAGVKSIFHHIIGATLVEFDGDGDVFCRQINASDDGTFYDLDCKVEEGRVTSGHRIKALVCGDIHTRKLEAANTIATFGMDPSSPDIVYVDNVVDTLRPEYLFLHDVFDNEARNHHNVGDSAYSYEMAIRGRSSVSDEINDSADFIVRSKRPGTNVKVVDSNHDLGLEKYVREGRYRNDGENVRLGLRLDEAYMAFRERVAIALDGRAPAPTFSLFEHAAREIRGDALADVQWIHDGTSFLVDGIECGHHGFRGSNGAQGTISGFARIGRKMTIGDKHSPEILDGVYCAGCMNLHHGYNKGPSSWAIAHVVQYQNGKRSIITLQRGKWRAARPRVRKCAPKAA
jgi:hypothetical protein